MVVVVCVISFVVFDYECKVNTNFVIIQMSVWKITKKMMRVNEGIEGNEGFGVIKG